MGKLHEVLAVEGNLKGVANKVREEAHTTFSKRVDHFVETVTEQKYFDDEDSRLNTTESKAMVTTVFDKLKYIVGPISRYYDAYLEKEATNQEAKADIVVGTKVIYKNVPVGVLLGMETMLRELRDVYESTPTLAPGIHWEQDTTRSTGVYRSKDPEVRFVTKKNIRPIVLSPATDKHPAQIEKISEDVPTAKKTITTYSSMLSASDKSQLLARIDQLIIAVKRARQVANGTEVVKSDQFGEKIFDFIHEGIVK